MTQQAKTNLLPVAMLTGVAFGLSFPAVTAMLNGVIPWLIFVMLLIPYCRISPGELKPGPMHFRMLVVQLLLAALAYLLLFRLNPLFAQGAFICFFGPTATAAPVIAAMLGGSISAVITYSLLSSLAVALLSPFVFSLIGTHTELSFFASVWLVGKQIFPLLLMPLVLAFLLRRFVPRLHAVVRDRQSVSYYLWVTAMVLVMGRATAFLVSRGTSGWMTEAGLAGVAVLSCMLQFFLGHKLGVRYGEPVAGTQGLGQKNTVLMIWMSLT
ncbi:MAG: hypothetical protein AB7D05_03815, partial [Mangrovibacterium sp.]